MLVKMAGTVTAVLLFFHLSLDLHVKHLMLMPEVLIMQFKQSITSMYSRKVEMML